MKLNSKIAAENLGALVGVDMDSPTNEAITWHSQFTPDMSLQQPNMDNPLGGDDAFYNYLIPGAAFRAKDGSEWEVLAYEWDGRVEIQNRWYPTIHANLPVMNIRRSIHAWIDPTYLEVPPMIPGVVPE